MRVKVLVELLQGQRLCVELPAGQIERIKRTKSVTGKGKIGTALDRCILDNFIDVERAEHALF